MPIEKSGHIENNTERDLMQVPFVSVHGTDLLFCEKTGKIYVLEVNGLNSGTNGFNRIYGEQNNITDTIRGLIQLHLGELSPSGLIAESMLNKIQAKWFFPPENIEIDFSREVGRQMKKRAEVDNSPSMKMLLMLERLLSSKENTDRFIGLTNDDYLKDRKSLSKEWNYSNLQELLRSDYKGKIILKPKQGAHGDQVFVIDFSEKLNNKLFPILHSGDYVFEKFIESRKIPNSSGELGYASMRQLSVVISTDPSFEEYQVFPIYGYWRVAPPNIEIANLTHKTHPAEAIKASGKDILKANIVTKKFLERFYYNFFRASSSKLNTI